MAMRDERYYRGVKIKIPDFWRENGKVAPAAFIDGKGASVEKCSNRQQPEVIGHMKTYLRSKNAFYSVLEAHCEEAEVFVQPYPILEPVPNRYHCLLLPQEHAYEELTITQAEYLAERAFLEHRDDSSPPEVFSLSFT